jgi:hypothetical protein
MYDIGMAEKDIVKDQSQTFMFPKGSISIEAASLEEATKIYIKQLKENKESDNA